MSKPIAVVTINVDERPRVYLLHNDIPSMQKLVGGLIDIIPFECGGESYELVFNKKGAENHLPANFPHSDRMGVVFGNAFITKMDSEGNFITLNETDVDNLLSMLYTFHRFNDLERRFIHHKNYIRGRLKLSSE